MSDKQYAVKLVTTNDGEATQKALEALKMLPGAIVEVQYCPLSVADWFEYPFIRVNGGDEFFGLKDIEWFVARELQPCVQ